MITLATYRPLSIGMKNPTFEVTFIVATINPDSDAQSTIAPASLPAKITQVFSIFLSGKLVVIYNVFL